jgi:TonB family protein
LKLGNNDSYEDVKFSTQGTKVSVTATVRSSRSGDTERFFAAYGRDDKRILKIQELKMAVFAPYSYTAAEFREMFVKRVQPEYPYSARALRHVEHGTFRLAVNEQGRVSSVKTVKSTGYTELDRSCLVALGQWQAKPGTKRVVDVPVEFTTGSGNTSPSQTWNLPPPISNRLGPAVP